MFTPNYTITDKLLINIKRINTLVSELNNRRFPHVILFEFERAARAVSAHASTSIEGNPLPLTEVKKILKSTPAHIRDSEREVLNYNKALLHLNKKLTVKKPVVSPNLILNIHKLVMEGLLPAYDVGAWRRRPVIVNDPRTGQAVYLAPNAADVPSLMTDLIHFAHENRNTVDSLILAGIFHKQMVVIHPFMDGNGRTTRLVTKVLLAEMGLDTFNLFSFEQYYNSNVTRYFQHVGERGDYYERKGQFDFTAWLEYFSEGIIDELLRVQDILPRMSVSPDTQLHEYHHKIINSIREKGFIKDSGYAKLVDRAKATRTLDFQKLIKLQLIERKGKGKATYYVLRET